MNKRMEMRRKETVEMVEELVKKMAVIRRTVTSVGECTYSEFDEMVITIMDKTFGEWQSMSKQEFIMAILEDMAETFKRNDDENDKEKEW